MNGCADLDYRRPLCGAVDKADNPILCLPPVIDFGAVSFFKMEMGGKATRGLSRLDYRKAKVGGRVKDGIAAREILDTPSPFCYLRSSPIRRRKDYAQNMCFFFSLRR